MLRKLATQWGLAFAFMVTTAPVWAHPPKVVVIPLGGDEAPTSKTIFVTSGTYSGDLKTAGAGDDGPSGADNLCMAAAGVANSKVKGKVFKAWLSSDGPATFNGSGREFVFHDLPYRNVNGEIVFVNLWNLRVVPSFSILTELGEIVTGNAQFPWTGIQLSGLFASDTCSNWTSIGPATGLYGQITISGTGYWTERAYTDCTLAGSLLCVEQ